MSEERLRLTIALCLTAISLCVVAAAATVAWHVEAFLWAGRYESVPRQTTEYTVPRTVMEDGQALEVPMTITRTTYCAFNTRTGQIDGNCP